MKKRIALFSALAAFACILAAPVMAEEGYKIGITVGDLSNPIWAEVCNEAQERAASLGCTADVVACNNDAPTQISQVETFITEGVDAIIIGAADSASMDDVCKKAMDAGIVVISASNPGPTKAPEKTNHSKPVCEIHFKTVTCCLLSICFHQSPETLHPLHLDSGHPHGLFPVGFTI